MSGVKGKHSNKASSFLFKMRNLIKLTTQSDYRDLSTVEKKQLL